MALQGGSLPFPRVWLGLFNTCLQNAAWGRAGTSRGERRALHLGNSIPSWISAHPFGMWEKNSCSPKQSLEPSVSYSIQAII